MVTAFRGWRVSSAYVRLLTRRRGAYCMSMPMLKQHWTVEDLWNLPEDGNRYELIDGELLVTPAPRFDHQEAVAIMLMRLRDYLKRERIGHAVMSPADIVFSPTTLVQPDVFVVPLQSGKRPANWKDIHHLIVAVEVLSPSTARADR